jgi:hypothetical protein
LPEGVVVVGPPGCPKIGDWPFANCQSRPVAPPSKVVNNQNPVASACQYLAGLPCHSSEVGDAGGRVPIVVTLNEITEKIIAKKIRGDIFCHRLCWLGQIPFDALAVSDDECRKASIKPEIRTLYDTKDTGNGKLRAQKEVRHRPRGALLRELPLPDPAGQPNA